MEAYFCILDSFRKFNKNKFILHRLENGEISYTYEEISLEALRLQVQLEHLNIMEFSGVAVCIQNTDPASVVVLLSILNNRCFFCFLDSKISDANFHLTLSAHNAIYLIKDSNIASHEQFKLLGYTTVLGKQFHIFIVKEIPVSTHRLLRSREFCYSITTSGSTTKPKVIYVPYKCIQPNIKSLSRLFQISASDVIFLGSPPTFDPFIVELFLAMQNGATLLITNEKFRVSPHKKLEILFPSLLKKGLREEKKWSPLGVTVLQMTPSIFRLFGVSGIHQMFLNANSTLRTLILGGEEFPSRREWDAWLPSIPRNKSIYNIYGVTEISCWSTIKKFDLNDQLDCIPLGVPFDNETQVRLIDVNGEVLEGTTEGHLQVGSCTRRCYIPSIDTVPWRHNETIFRNTGDWVHRDRKGNLFYRGRIDNIVKRLGQRLCLEELQRKILKLLDYRCEAICMWDQVSPKLLCFLSGSYLENQHFKLFRSILMNKLLNEEKPDAVIHVSVINLNSHGKINRSELLRIAYSKKIYNNPLEVLHEFITDTLGFNLHNCTEPVLPSFTSIGGTSFQAISLTNEISTLFLDSVFKNTLLEMLLNPQQSLSNVIQFLTAWRVETRTTHEVNMERKELVVHSIKFHLNWRTNFNKCVDSAPIIVDNSWICVGSHSHELMTLDIEYGTIKARLKLSDRIECKVEISRESQMAFVGCYDGNLYAFNVKNGTIFWSINVGGMIKAKPLLCDAGLIVASYAETYNIICISVKSQEIIWRRKIGTRGIYANPIALDDASLLVCTLDGTCSKIEAKTGQTSWTSKASSPIFSTPAVINKGLHFVFAEVTGKLHVCNVNNADVVGCFFAGGNIFSSLTVASYVASECFILFGCFDKRLYCLRCTSSKVADRFSLNLLWQISMEDTIFATPVVISIASQIYVLGCSTKGSLFVILLEGGEVLGQHQLCAEVFSTPCTLGDKIFLGTRDNYVYCFTLK